MTAILLAAVLCGEPPTPPRPVVICYVTESCPPCRQARRQLTEAAAALPFVVEYRESAPAWVTVYPTFHWYTGERWVQVRGWHGLDATTLAVRETR